MAQLSSSNTLHQSKKISEPVKAEKVENESNVSI